MKKTIPVSYLKCINPSYEVINMDGLLDDHHDYLLLGRGFAEIELIDEDLPVKHEIEKLREQVSKQTKEVDSMNAKIQALINGLREAQA